jgi:hypothetical protein
MLPQVSILEFYVATPSHEIGLFYFYMLAVICRCTLYALQQLDPLKKKKGGDKSPSREASSPHAFF